MMDYQSLVERKLEPVGQSNNDIIYRCPYCEGDTGSGHLYVNYDKNYWHCFKCNLGGKRMESLLRALHIDISYDYQKLYSEVDKELDDIISSKKSKRIERVVEYSTNIEALTQYYIAQTKPLSQEAYQYLLNRRVSQEMIQVLQIREGINRYGENIKISDKDYLGRDYSGRIMVPSLRKDGLVSFYVARDYIGDKAAKYLNPPKDLAVASEDTWSLDIIETSCVIICEGVFTAIAVNQALGKISACATYGKSIAKNSSSEVRVTSQGEKLLAKKFKQYIIFYDKDASLEARETAKYLYDRGAKVRVVNITTDKYGPKADAADMTREEVLDHIKNSKEYDGFIGLW